MTTRAYIDEMAALVRLPIEDAWKPGVATFLGLAAEMAAILETTDLDDAELILAPIFQLPELGSDGSV